MTAFRKLAILVLLLIAPAATAMAEAPAVTVRLPADIDPTDTLAAMIAAAYRTGDDATINAVVGVAKATFPGQVVLIDRLAAGDAAVLAASRRDEQERERERIMSRASSRSGRANWRPARAGRPERPARSVSMPRPSSRATGSTGARNFRDVSTSSRPTTSPRPSA
jgi:hypothetical protein